MACSLLTLPSLFWQTDRIKIGIFMESDLIALKSSDDILQNNSTRPTIMATRAAHETIPNWLIMSRAKAPFLKRMMVEYNKVWKAGGWDKLALQSPSELAKDDLDVTILDGHTWYYPLASEENGDVTLKKLWFGKSWSDIDRSYGTHIWHWDERIRALITPHIVNAVDTPLLCKIRPLFQELDNATSVESSRKSNPNCTIATADELKVKDHKAFSDYQADNRDHHMKWVDSSGFHNHGWAPNGMELTEINGTLARNITDTSFAVLPVSNGWDTREWTARMELMVDNVTPQNGFGLFKIRTEGEGEIVVGMAKRKFPLSMMVDSAWKNSSEPRKKVGQFITPEDEQKWIPASKLRPLERSFHNLAITYDRRVYGNLTVYLDGEKVGSQRLSILGSPKVGQDIWINALEWHQLDMGFRGSLRRFTMYAEALSMQDLAHPVSISHSSFFPTLDTQRLRGRSSPLLALTLFMIGIFFILRSRKILSREIPRYLREMIRRLRQLSDSRFS